MLCGAFDLSVFDDFRAWLNVSSQHYGFVVKRWDGLDTIQQVHGQMKIPKRHTQSVPQIHQI